MIELAKYMIKEVSTIETLGYVSFALGFSLVIGATVYVSSVGLIYILHSYGIPIGSKVINYLALWVGSTIVSKTVKSIIKG